MYSGPWAFCEQGGGEGARDAGREFGVRSREMLITRAAADSLAQGEGGDRWTSQFGGLASPIHHPHTHLYLHNMLLNIAI